MAYPDFGYVKIYPDQVTIVQGLNGWSFNNIASPQPASSQAALQTYFDLRTPNLPTAPCVARANEQPAASGVYVPFIGDYELSFSPSSRGIEFYTNFPPTGILEATADLNSAAFPMGMALLQLYVRVGGFMTFANGRNILFDNAPLKFFGATVLDYVPPIFPVNATLISTNFSSPGAIIPIIGQRWSITQGMKTFGFTIPITAGVHPGPTPDIVITECYLIGFYNNQQFAFTTDKEDVLPGDITTYTNPDGILESFDPDEWEILWDAQPGDTEDPDFPGFTGGVKIPRNLIFNLTQNILQYKMPTGMGIPYGGRRLMLVGTGLSSAFFTGRFAFQNYNITLVDGSGLYTLTPGKHNDTYYDRSGAPPYPTVDLRIPDQYVKTGFFNG